MRAIELSATKYCTVTGNLAPGVAAAGVTVADDCDGFEDEGQRYRSLSAIAKLVSGSHVNGFRFFKLGGDA